MTIDAVRPLFAAAALLGLSACTTNALMEQPGDAQFGDANRQTIMAQVINPDPVYTGEMATSGDHAADAISRYRDGKVKQPDTISTTAGVSGSGPN